MNILETENFFGNSSFFFLFFSMIAYWVEISFGFKKWNIGRISMIAANFCLFSLLILRWKESGHFPLSNLYESLMFLSWSLSTFLFVLENIEFETNSFVSQNFVKNNLKEMSVQNTEKQSFVGAFLAPTALFINAFATFRLPPEMQQSSALVPALQSNWLMMHVTVMILSYAALICGSLLSIAFLIVTNSLQLDSNFSENVFESEKKESNFVSTAELGDSFVPKFSLSSVEGAQTNFELPSKRISNLNVSNNTSLKRNFAEKLDNLSYRILGIGFPLLTIGILSGAVWANEAWGSYWSWDPKETWALATWFVFAIYLHTRLTKGWNGKKPALIASLGFVTVWICFLGVNLLGEGLHSYGFLKNPF